MSDDLSHEHHEHDDKARKLDAQVNARPERDIPGRLGEGLSPYSISLLGDARLAGNTLKATGRLM